ncbi:MAG: PIN domain-containing protein [Thermoanaerobaculaceae bacterium]|jgi:predicted nucleic acid-binding protein|nr:PIN domain-containing protein [Thermoanaerobaculaceae bacterium]
MNVEFLDTNVLVYSLDPTTPDKHNEAKTLVARLATEGTGGLSVQVLQELVWVMTRRVPRPLAMTTALSVVEKLMLWPVFSPNAADVLLAGRLAEEARLSFWDAMIVHAASELGATILWTEDLNPGQIIAGVEIRTPFAPTRVSER